MLRSTNLVDLTLFFSLTLKICADLAHCSVVVMLRKQKLNNPVYNIMKVYHSGVVYSLTSECMILLPGIKNENYGLVMHNTYQQ